MIKLSKRSLAELSMLGVAFIWGTTFVVVKNALNDIGPFLFIGMRFTLAFLVLAAFSFDNITKVNKNTLLSGSLLGFFLFIGYVFQTIGLKYTTSSNAGLITGLNVILVPVIYYVLNKTMPSLRSTLTVILATIGLYLLSVPAGHITLAYGDLLVLICAFGFAFHIVFVDRHSYKHNAVAITGIQILFVGVLCLIIGLVTEPWPAQFSTAAVAGILITSVFATSLAFLLMNAMQKYSTPTRFALVLVTEPIFAALAGYLWADEILSTRGLIGGFLILAAMSISIVTRKTKNYIDTNV